MGDDGASSHDLVLERSLVLDETLVVAKKRVVVASASGPRRALDAANARRVVAVAAGADARFERLAIVRGDAGDGGDGDGGAGAYVEGFATFRGCVVEDNDAGASGFGGGVYVVGRGVFVDTFVRKNRALYGAGVYRGPARRKSCPSVLIIATYFKRTTHVVQRCQNEQQRCSYGRESTWVGRRYVAASASATFENCTALPSGNRGVLALPMSVETALVRSRDLVVVARPQARSPTTTSTSTRRRMPAWEAARSSRARPASRRRCSVATAATAAPRTFAARTCRRQGRGGHPRLRRGHSVETSITLGTRRERSSSRTAS